MTLWIGIDPGLATCGFAVLRLQTFHVPLSDRGEDRVTCVGLGVLRTKKLDGDSSITLGNTRRAYAVARALENVIGGRAPESMARGAGVKALFPNETISSVCVEAMSFPRSSSAAAKMAMTWGIIIANCVRRGIPLEQKRPQEVKLAVAGTQDASKKHVERVLLKIYGGQIRYYLRTVTPSMHEHAFDALAVAHSFRPPA